MPVVTKTVLKSYFEDGKEPDENKYIDLIDTMALSGDIISDHGALSGLGDNDHPQYLLASAAITDHGALSGLGDDDHTQYVLANGTRAISGNASITGGLGVGTIGFVTTSGRVKVTERLYVGVGLHVGNTSPASNPGDNDAVIDGNVTAGGTFYGQNLYLYEGGTQMIDLTAQDTTWARINQNTAKNIYTPRYFAAAVGLQAGNSTNPGSGYVGYTAGLRPNKNSTQYYTYGYFGSASYYSSTAWDGDAKGNTGGTLIDLSAVFGVPAGVKAVNMRILGKANNAGPTDGHWFFCGPSATYDAHSGVYLWGNVYMSETGIVSCDGNGDINYTVSSTATCYCIIRILGYFI